MKLTQRLSLKLRLTLLFLLLAFAAWFAASLVAWQQTAHKVDKLFDTQQMLFAKRLLTLELDENHASARMRNLPEKAKHGKLDDDALTFAIYSTAGRMVLNDGDQGRDIPYRYRRDGFTNGELTGDNDAWRFIWLTSPDGRYRVVVGQELEYREEMALDIVASQLTPWLVALPLMLIALIVLLNRELMPLKRLAQALRNRSPDATNRLDSDVPPEVRPLLDALNHLFVRTREMMNRERRFTSDAAHELRSPLAALKVQTDVAQLCADDAVARDKALAQLHAGIDRASRLVDQLLTLSRLDSLDNLQDIEPVAMADLLQSGVMDIYPAAQRAGIEVRLHIHAPQVVRKGQPLLLGLLVRNLLDNAVRYSPRGSTVEVTLEEGHFTVQDNGPGLPPDALARVGERFYRPPGQEVAGSGLGLSIVKRIAALHQMTLRLENAPKGGFTARIGWSGNYC
ncbi:quorum sensing histidine kinase QseC [Pseudenterobacter timonensis]|uniref:quorum sensing histidine kinase QseC n=1 Tax=Pseudenterobacter timonensis TaxID=1755099 RepID=UPI00077B6D93|nr:quorum sensing histidine kinase QseC [Pseudenterobacter timonensis]